MQVGRYWPVWPCTKGDVLENRWRSQNGVSWPGYFHLAGRVGVGSMENISLFHAGVLL